jgi:hypothetical protein
MGLIFVGGIEYLLEQIAVGRKSYTRSVGNVCRQIKDCISVMMLGNLHEVLCTSIRKEVNPFFGIEDGCCEVLNEVIVNHIWAVSVEMVLPGLIRFSRATVESPPVPFSVCFCDVVSMVRSLGVWYIPFSPELPQPGTL